MNVLRLVFCGGMVLWLSACAWRPQVQTEDVRQQLWREHQAKVAQRGGNWRLTGRIGIVSEGDSGVATLYWEQHPQSFSMKIVAPLGRGVVSIQGDGGRILMRDTDGQMRSADSAEELIRERTGWSIPVQGLQHWALGVLDSEWIFHAGANDSYTLNAEGCLQSLLSGPWLVEYQRYMTVQGLRLPQKFSLRSDGLQLRLVVTKWELL